MNPLFIALAISLVCGVIIYLILVSSPEEYPPININYNMAWDNGKWSLITNRGDIIECEVKDRVLAEEKMLKYLRDRYGKNFVFIES